MILTKDMEKKLNFVFELCSGQSCTFFGMYNLKFKSWKLSWHSSFLTNRNHNRVDNFWSMQATFLFITYAASILRDIYSLPIYDDLKLILRKYSWMERMFQFWNWGIFGKYPAMLAIFVARHVYLWSTITEQYCSFFTFFFFLPEKQVHT